MKDFQSITQVKVTGNSDEVNRLLEDFWQLLDVFHNNEGDLFFVLGNREPLISPSLRSA